MPRQQKKTKKIKSSPRKIRSKNSPSRRKKSPPQTKNIPKKLQKKLAPFLKKIKIFRQSRFFIPLTLAIILSSLLFYFFILKDLPSPTKLSSADFPVSTQIFSQENTLLYEIYTDKNRTPVKLAELPQYLLDATVAGEDRNFYSHHGFDLKGILRGAYNTLFKKSLQGGSTITQQLIKNALLTQERTIQRKIREALLSFLTEVIYSKEEILEMYLNQSPYGGTAWGIEAAAKTYFAKSARDLTLPESALLAGLPASPTRFSPFGSHPELAKSRQERVLDQMVEAKYLSPESAQEAKNTLLEFTTPSIEIKAPHFVLWIKELLEEQLGPKMVEQGGLRVYTTINYEIQEQAQNIVYEEIADLKKAQVGNGAALVTEPSTGRILAMVGSHNYFDLEQDGQVNITLAKRQPGSSIKPLNYALGLETKQLTLASVLNDVPTCFQVTGQALYCPVNYDGQFHGPVQARFALGNSYNIPAVKTLFANGLKEFVEFARSSGLSTLEEAQNYGLSLTLGGGEVTMYDLATAFSIFPNKGIRQNLYPIEKIANWQGDILYEHRHQEGPRLISMETAYLISHALLDNNARSAAFGTGSSLVVRNHPEVSVKTGTTNDRRDNWTIGYTPDYLVTTWVGNNDNSPMSYVASGVTGASPIWNQIFRVLLENKDQNWPLKPDGVIGTHICRLSGLLPNPNSPCETRFEYFTEGTIPQETEVLTREIAVNRDTDQLTNLKTPPELIEMRPHQIIWDKLGTGFCLDCPFPTEPISINANRAVSTSPAPFPSS